MEHQQALADHRENSKRGLGEEDDAGNNDHRTGTTAATIEEEILKTQKDMERFLDGWENKHHEKKREQRLDRLEERSRETDSQSDPQNSSREGSSGGGSGSGSNTSSGGGSGRDERTGAQVDAMARDSKMPSAAAAATVPNPAAPPPPEPSPPPPMPAPPTYEELQRRYLQINTLRRTEYSVRVLNALLYAWPKSVKTSSEGGRLPLHMACFGKATVKVMETILKAYPDAARQRNHDGFLPIHIAAHWGVSHPDIAPLILRAYPDGAVGRNRWERTPIEERWAWRGRMGGIIN